MITSSSVEEASLVAEARDSALICTQGHVITRWMAYSPHGDRRFCEECGSPTLSSCPSCGAPIPSDAGNYAYRPPRFCRACGAPYPWTEAAIAAAHAYADTLHRLSRQERELLKGAITDLVRDDAGRQGAALRYRALVAKAGGAAWDVFHDILVNVVSEAIRRSLYGA